MEEKRAGYNKFDYMYYDQFKPECEFEHTHEQAQILIPLWGAHMIFIFDQEYRVNQNQLGFIPPDTKHRCFSEGGLIAVNIPHMMFCDLDRKILSRKVIYDIPNDLIPLIEMIKNEAKKDAHSTSIHYLYYFLYYKLLRHNYSKSISHIHDHYDEPIDIAILAGLENYNPTYFNKWFKNQMGYSPHRYLMKVRIDKAKELLINTDFEITDIALQVGYSNHSSFTRVFKELEGITPYQFRAAERNSAHKPFIIKR